MNPHPDPWTTSPAEVRHVVERLRAAVPHLVARLRPDGPLSACAFDSLEVVELLCAFEAACGVRLATGEAEAGTTGTELLARVASRSRPFPAPPLTPRAQPQPKPSPTSALAHP